MPTIAPEHRQSLDVFIQSAGLRTIQAAMFRAWLREHGHTEPMHATYAEWTRWYREALQTVVTDH